MSKKNNNDKLTLWESLKVILIVFITIAVMGLPVYLIREFLDFKLSYILWYLIITFIAYKKGYFKPYDYNENENDDEEDDDSYYDETDSGDKN